MPIHVISLSGCLVHEIQQEIALRFEFCIPLHSIHQAQQDLFATAAPAESARTPPLPPALGGDAAGAGSCAQADPAGAGAGSSLGPPAGGPPAYEASWVCRIVPGL